jgi:hypothetical protein
MARLILETFGRERLIAHVGEPIAFVRDYQEAAGGRLGPKGERRSQGETRESTALPYWMSALTLVSSRTRARRHLGRRAR